LLRFIAGFFSRISSRFSLSFFFNFRFVMPVIALDLGGTKLAAALFSDDGKILHTETVELEKREGEAVGLLIVQLTNQFLQKALSKDLIVSSLGICVPGIACAQSGRVWAPNIPGWDEYPLLDELQRELDDKNIRIRIDSDRACYILGEVWKGNARGCRDAVFLSVGTGIGAGILINNQVLRGANDIAGAIGWMALSKPFRKEYATYGCFEYNASGIGMPKVAKELMNTNAFQSSLPAEHNREFTTKEIFSAYKMGDDLAAAVIRNAIEYWGMAVANLVSLFNPEKIIFGGGLFGPALQFLDKISDEAKKWAQPISMQHVKLEESGLGNEAGLYGAACLALHR
jgi:glucokinase